ITLPHILFATAPLLIVQYTTNFNNFNIIYLFNEGGPAVKGQNAGSTDILISWIYKLTFDTNNYSMAATVSLIIGVLISLFALFRCCDYIDNYYLPECMDGRYIVKL